MIKKKDSSLLIQFTETGEKTSSISQSSSALAWPAISPEELLDDDDDVLVAACSGNSLRHQSQIFCSLLRLKVGNF